jgi:hypothetical protein
MFCSSDCRDDSFKRYHQYECPIMDQLLQSGGIHMPLRQFFIALSSFDGSVEQLQKFFNDNEGVNTSVFEFDLSSKNGETDRNLLLALRSSIKSSHKFSLEEHEKILVNHPQLSEVFIQNRDFILSFLLRQCQICDLNIHGIFTGSSRIISDPNKAFGQMQQAVGTGSLLFGSLTNHSCANKVFRIYVEGKVAYSVSRPIQKGSQLFDCYK